MKVTRVRTKEPFFGGKGLIILNPFGSKSTGPSPTPSKESQKQQEPVKPETPKSESR